MLVSNWLNLTKHFKISPKSGRTRRHGTSVSRSRSGLIDLHQNTESLEDRTLLTFDFGDAPLPFPTTTDDDGARHADVGLLLGTTRDTESNGVPSAQADSDSNEDGVSFGTVQAGALDASITVNVLGGNGRLDGWIDFNGDGNWGGANERIFASAMVIAGENQLQFDVPPDARAGDTFARFRLSSAGGLGPRGEAPDGEVEDYIVSVESPLPASNDFLGPNDVSNVRFSNSKSITVDVDDDGDMDVVKARGDLYWYENDGNQQFTEHPIDVSTTGRRVAAADLDRDGDLDFVVAGSSNGVALLAWYENGGSQDFVEHEIVRLEGQPPIRFYNARTVSISDIDGDGNLDILASITLDDDTVFTSNILWYQNDGNQNFTQHFVDFFIDTAPSFLAAVDIDKDGDQDLVSDGEGIAWYENDGDNDFTRRVVDPAISNFDIADVDGDGDIDFIAKQDQVKWYENLGDSTFTTHAFDTDLVRLEDVIAIDIDGDADIDLLGRASFAVLLYESVGGQFVPHEIASDIDRFNVGDIDGDGLLDVVIDGVLGTTWYANGGLHDVELGGSLPISTTSNAVRDIAGVDIDEDGDLDIVSASAGDDTIAWHENSGGGQFLKHTISSTSDSAQSVFPIDLDGDGDVDVLAASALDDTVAWFENDGDEAFVEHVISQSADFAQSVYAADIDDDGDMDVLSASALDNKIAWYENDGVQGFTVHVVDTNASSAESVVAADINSDGHVDILASSGGTDEIVWYANDGSEVFERRTVASDVDFATEVLAIDLDKDGDTDVVSASALDNTIAWFSNDGSEQFTKHVIWGEADSANSVFVIDFEGDGDLDVLSASSGRDTLTLHLNDGEQNFFTLLVSETSDFAHSVIAGDVDGDGDNDFVGASSLDNTIAWFQRISPPLPTVAITRAAASPVSTDEVIFNVDFNVAVSGVDVNDFVVTTTGTATISEPIQLDAADDEDDATYRVTVSGITGSGVVGLELIGGSEIVDASGDFLSTSPEPNHSYTIDNTPPTVTGISRTGRFVTSATSVQFTVTFNEPVTGVTIDDFVIDADGVTDSELVEVTGSGATWMVTVQVGTGSGRLSIDFDATAGGGVSDALGLVATDNFVVGATYQVVVATPGITLADTDSLVVDERGSMATFTVAIDKQPLSDVVLTIVSGDTSEVLISPSTLTFTNDNFDAPQTVTVTGQSDSEIADGDVSVSVVVSVVQAASDSEYASVAAQTITVTNRSHVSATTVSLSGRGRVGDFVVVESLTGNEDLDVELRAEDGQTILSPGADGRISFAGFPAGDYQVLVNDLPESYSLTVSEGFGTATGEPAIPALDLGGDGNFGFSTDGILLLAYSLGARGSDLEAFRGDNEQRTGAEIETQIEQLADSLDLDGNGRFDFGTDGIALLAYQLGIRGDQLSQGSASGGTRSGTEMETRLDGLLSHNPTAARRQTPSFMDEVGIAFHSQQGFGHIECVADPDNGRAGVSMANTRWHECESALSESGGSLTEDEAHPTPLLDELFADDAFDAIQAAL